jgi:mRNA interferase RelE/StbE
VSKVYEVLLEPRARKELDKVPTEAFSKIDRAILALAQNPRPFGAKKLDKKLHRIRVGDWRILYAIFDTETRIVILRVVRRNEKTYRSV